MAITLAGRGRLAPGCCLRRRLDVDLPVDRAGRANVVDLAVVGRVVEPRRVPGGDGVGRAVSVEPVNSTGPWTIEWARQLLREEVRRA
jgi:hypothetical protein